MAAGDALQHNEISTLYVNHYGWLHSWLRKKIGNSSPAADLAHDIFLRLLSRDTAIEAREPRAFLTTVAQRVLANHWRRQALEQAYLTALSSAPTPCSLSPEERALRLEKLEEIDCRLSGLPTQVRSAFLLAQLDDLSHAEIAAILHISVSTVKRHLVRAGVQCYFALLEIQ